MTVLLCSVLMLSLVAAATSSASQSTVGLRLDEDGSESTLEAKLTLFKQGSPTSIRINWAVEDGTASIGSDLGFVASTVYFKPEEYEKEIIVKILDDNDVEGDEHFFVRLDNPRDTEILPDAGLVQVNIVDNDAPSKVGLRLDEDGSESTLEAKLTLFKQGPATSIRINWAVEDGTASIGSDLGFVASTVYFKPDEYEKKIIVKILDDNDVEGDEHFFVRLDNPRDTEILPDAGLVQVNIVDNDVATPVDPTPATPEQEACAQVRGREATSNEFAVSKARGVRGTDSDSCTDACIKNGGVCDHAVTIYDAWTTHDYPNCNTEFSNVCCCHRNE